MSHCHRGGSRHAAGVTIAASGISTGGLGLLAATTAAVLWSVATILYRRAGRVLPPVRMNLFRGIAAILLLGIVLAVESVRADTNPLALSPHLLAWLALSGVVGIGGGDTCYFAALNRLGPRRTLLLFMLAPVLTALLAWPLFGEGLAFRQIAGIALTCGGVTWVIAERTGGSDGHVDALGLTFAFGAAFCQAAGALTSRFVFDHADYGAAPSALIRIAAGVAVLIFALPLDRFLRDPGGRDAPRAAPWLTLLAATFLGTFLGIWLQQAAFKFSTHVGVASTLLATSPLFVLPLVAMGGERVSPRAVTGAVIGVLGIAVLLV